MRVDQISIRKMVQKKFKIRGYTLKVEALNEILSFVDRFQDAEEEAIDVLLDWLHKQTLKTSILDKEPVHRVINLLLEAEAATEDHNPTPSTVSSHSALRIIDAFLVPKFRFDHIRKQFFQHTGSLPIHGEASAKAALYRERLLLLLQRVARDPHFSKPAFDTEMSSFGSCEISPIQSLIGQTGTKWVMGVISQLEDGHFYLEDLTSSMEINLSKAKITTGFFSENTIIVAEGKMLLDGIFEVITCGFPPLEDRDKSLKITAGHDFFGSGTLTREETLRLADLEKRAVNDMFVILSDIWLDDDEVMGKLETILNGFEGEEVVPSLFVFMGNFCSRPCNLSFNSFSSLRLQFGKLGKLIKAHPRLNEHSRFLFIPGPDDAGPSTVLPRCALPKYLTQEIQNHVPNAIFSSNPCRIKFYTQEIVFFRQDLLYRMRRSCLIPPSTEETDDPFKHLVATITHQSHLCPLPLIVQPIIWNYDHCLHLYPTPHTIILGDKSEQKAFKYTGITCFNPGSFSNDSTFVAYRPCTQEVEFSSL
ncbi:DNA_pol_E_B domain-containing protein/Dpoe2NT domain-containing protein [Cephalotus follicularis]|uniref:DNA polymerase epsilon subunit n=1 Tax=Cephalotus follicularis TaxID=3775 RepID=A0A1Q3BL23_CEPFO|nr:DNA_pol_E_B domain-containing protein/Dpoe2NT domain-containing protein [Cephalotus follicularis]